MIRVLFVCLGNICRSPMAEGVFQHKVKEAGLSNKITTDSAGTGHWHIGKPPHQGTRQILEVNGIAYSHRARQIAEEDLDAFDYILTMDEMNWYEVQILGRGTAKIARFLDYAPQFGIQEVPDPYYTGGFGEVYKLVDAAATGLLTALRTEYQL